MRKIYSSIFEMVGRTPMFEFSNFRKRLSLKGKIFGKCEFYNPLFSIKDRATLNMVDKALESGWYRGLYSSLVCLYVQGIFYFYK